MEEQILKIESLGYDIVFGDGFAPLIQFLQDQNYTQIAVLTDSNTEKYCLPLLQTVLKQNGYDFFQVSIEAGEKNKNFDSVQYVCSKLIGFQLSRKAVLLNLGGGVVGDLGGFCASIYKRGIDFIQMPSTLLSQVDASVGGKTGIDFQNLKNIVGVFQQPVAIFIMKQFLETLPRREKLSGFAEMLKHGLIWDRNLFQELLKFDFNAIRYEQLYRSVSIKNEVVKEDPKEKKGLRKILNFGHTIGHAIEALSLAEDEIPLTHGEAVACGMVYEIELALQLEKISAQDAETAIVGIKQFFSIRPIQKAKVADMVKLIMNDKKNENSDISFSLISELGHCAYDVLLEASLIEKFLSEKASVSH